MLAQQRSRQVDIFGLERFPGLLMRRVGVDIGGTFTDLILVDDATGAFTVGKTLTTPDDPSRAVETVLARRRSSGTASTPADDRRRSSTARRWSPTRSSSARARRPRCWRPRASATRSRSAASTATTCTTSMLELPTPLVPRYLRFDVPRADARRRHDARRPLDDALRRAAGRASCAESRRRGGRDPLPAQLTPTPTHERPAREAVAARSRRTCASRSRPRWCPRSASTSAPRRRSPTSTSRAASSSYLRELESGWQRLGFGGELLADALQRRHRDASRPRRASRSGCSSRARRPARWPRRTSARPAGVADLLSFDMGGTTAKLVRDRGRPAADRARVRGRPRATASRRARGLPVKIAGDRDDRDRRRRRLDRARRRARAAQGRARLARAPIPGRSATARGGTEPTVTDADLVLGYLDPDFFLGGRMALDLDGARAGDRRRASPSRSGCASRRPPGASTRSSTRTWPAPRACTPSSAATTRAACRCSPSAAPGRCTASGVARGARLAALIVPFGAGRDERRSASWPRRWRSTSCAARAGAARRRSTGRASNALLAEMEAEGDGAAGASGVAAERDRARAQRRHALRRPGPRDPRPLPAGALDAGARRSRAAFEARVPSGCTGAGPGRAARGDQLARRPSGPRPTVELARRRPARRGDAAQGRARRPTSPSSAASPRRRSTTATGSRRARASTGPAIVEERESTIVVGPGAHASRSTTRWNLERRRWR